MVRHDAGWQRTVHLFTVVRPAAPRPAHVLHRALGRARTDWHIDGFRFDAPWWAYYNYRWTEDAGYRASWVVGGAIELVKEAFSAISPHHPETLFLVEGFDPMLLRSAHQQYPYDEWDALKALWAGEKTAAEARTILAWLGRVRTPGVGVVHWVDAHDSVWWPAVGEKWVRERHGDAVTRAATAVCALLGGPFMVFGGGEEGQESWLARLLALRRSHPVLADGAHTVERTEVSSPDVLPIHTWLGGSLAVGTDQPRSGGTGGSLRRSGSRE